MALVTREIIYTNIKKGHIYWDLTDGQTLIASYQREGGTPEESINEFDNAMDEILDGYVNVILCKKNKADKSAGGDVRNDIKLRVKAGGLTSNVKGIEENKSSSSDQSMIAKLIEENQSLKIQSMMQQFTDQIKNLQREIAELKSDDTNDDDDDDEIHPDDQIGKIDRLLNSNAGQKLLDRLFPQSKGIAGTDEDEVKVERGNYTADYIADQKKKCSQAAGRLLRVDGAAGDHLLLLADLAEKDIDIYNLALNRLKSM